MTQVDKNFVATGQLSAVDGMGPSPIATAGAVEHFAVIRKMAASSSSLPSSRSEEMSSSSSVET